MKAILRAYGLVLGVLLFAVLQSFARPVAKDLVGLEARGDGQGRATAQLTGTPSKKVLVHHATEFATNELTLAGPGRPNTLGTTRT